GCDDPRKAIRYLRLCTPFFVRIRSLLEGLSNDRFRFLVIQGVSAAKEYVAEEVEADDDDDEAEDAQEVQKVRVASGPTLDTDTAKLLHASIDNAHDFVATGDTAIPRPLACIKVPELPDFPTDHIDKHEQGQLAAEFFDWLLAGNRDGVLLRRKALSIESEREYKKTKRDLRQARLKRKRHHRNAPADQEDKKAMSI